jgi:hypothetical protein
MGVSRVRGPLPAQRTGLSSTFEHHVSAFGNVEHVAAPIDAEMAAEALKHGPRGALLLAAISVGLLRIGWLLSEDRWLIVVLSMLGAMMAIMVVTSALHALHPLSNVETINPVTLHG